MKGKGHIIKLSRKHHKHCAADKARRPSKKPKHVPPPARGSR